jgi:hypothetical protein
MVAVRRVVGPAKKKKSSAPLPTKKRGRRRATR